MGNKERVNHSRRRRYYEARSKEELQKSLVQFYNQGYSQHEIARLINVPRGTISRWMIEMGMKGRDPGEAGKVKSKIYKYDENFFSEVDTPDKAYIVGFINGDGYIVDRGKSKRLGITIAVNDAQILEAIAGYMNMVDMLKQRKNPYPNEQDKISLIVNSTKICNDLILLGISPQKTGKEQWIDFGREDLQWAFLRGMFDADGHIRVYKRNKYTQARFGITGNEKLLTDILTFLVASGTVAKTKSLFEKQGCFDLHINSLVDLKKIFYKLYTFGNLKLDRKYKIYSSLVR